MTQNLLRVGLAAAAILVGAIPAFAEKRVALVIGNGAYKNTVELPNAPADAQAVTGSLRRLGFHVVEGINLSHSGMTDKLREFSRALVGAEVGMFFYAGHGLQVAGENHLVAVDAALKREGDLEFETMKVDQVLRQMQRETKVKVVILDACRDNPLAQELSRSMAQSGPASRSRSTSIAAGMSAIDATSANGTLIAFATAPGSVALDGSGKNSPFTEALLQHMETPDIDIDVMMKRVRGQVTRSTGERQQPWTNSSLTADFYLKPGKDAQAAQSPAGTPVVTAALPQIGGGQPPANSFDPRQMELTLWQEAQKSKSVKDYQAYLDAYPNGTFAGVARNRVAAVGGKDGGSAATVDLTRDVRAAEATEATEGQLALDNKAWREIQRRLTGLGYNTRGVDGSTGPGTRKAVQDWQKARSYTATGYLNQPQYQALLVERIPEKKSAAVSSDEAKGAKTRTATPSSGAAEPRSGGGTAAQPSDGSAAVVGAIIGGAAGFAIGRNTRRR